MTNARSEAADPGREIRVLPVQSLDEATRQAYDHFVSSHPCATPYHRSAWLKATERSYGHRCYVLLAGDAQIVGALPVCAMKLPFLALKYVSLPYCDVGGPLAYDLAIKNCLLKEAAVALGISRAGLQVRFSGPQLNVSRTGELVGPSKVRMLLKLPATPDDLLRSFKPKLRSQIRKATKNGLEAEIVTTSKGIASFFRVYSDNMKRLGSPAHGLEWFEALKAEYGVHMFIGLVRYGKEVVGAGIVLENGNTAAVPWASTLSEFNPLSPNMLLYWHLLKEAIERGCTKFDFGRSTLGEGTYRFKKQWGADPHELNWASYAMNEGQLERGGIDSAVPPLRTRALAAWCWQRLPLTLANTLGPRLRKYISL